MAPWLETTLAPAALASAQAAGSGFPASRAAIRPAAKASPAPVVSTTCSTRTPGTCPCQSAPATWQPSAPNLTIAFWTPRARKSAAARAGSSMPVKRRGFGRVANVKIEVRQAVPQQFGLLIHALGVSDIQQSE